MEGDPTGVAAAAPVPESATPADAAPAQSEPTAASDAVAESRADDAGTPNQPTPESDDSAEDDGDDTEDADTTSEQTEEQKKLSRKERQRQREQERINTAVADAIAAKEREAQTAEQARVQQEESAKAAKARQDKLEAFLGKPDAPEAPGTLNTLRREIDDLNRAIRSELVEPKGADLDDMAAQVAERESRVTRLTENSAMAGEIEDLVWSSFGNDFASAAEFPEFADRAAKAKYLNAPNGVKGALAVFRETIRAAVEGEKAAEVSALTAKHDAELKAAQADRDSWRIRASGGEYTPEQAGLPHLASGQLTRAQFMSLPREQKEKMRRDQPGAVAEIYSRSA